MERTRITAILFVISAIAFGVLTVNEGLSGTDKSEKAESAATKPVFKWKVHRNEKWDYSVEYPSGWKVEVTLENVDQPEYVIKEKLSFFSPDHVEISIDVWSNPRKLDISQWLEKFGIWAVGEDAEISECTATALKLPAVCAREPGSLQAYEAFKCIFRKGDRVYRIVYTDSDSGRSRKIYERIINSIKFE